MDYFKVKELLVLFSKFKRGHKIHLFQLFLKLYLFLLLECIKNIPSCKETHVGILLRFWLAFNLLFSNFLLIFLYVINRMFKGETPFWKKKKKRFFFLSRRISSKE